MNNMIATCVLAVLFTASAKAEYTFRKAEGGTNCHVTTRITDVDVCKLAAEFIGQPFEKSVNTDQDRPGGCFWDQNGHTYFNTNFQSIPEWAGTGGLCDGHDPTAMCPVSHPYVYHDGDYCCETNMEGVNSREGEKCDGSVLSLTSGCCKDHGYTPCATSLCSDYSDRPVPTAMCPESHPFVYHNGDYCCEHNTEKVNALYGELCDGGSISLQSSCCKSDAYTPCSTSLCEDFHVEPIRVVITHGGNANGAPCVFPFEGYGQTHNECTRLKPDGVSLYDFYWCATTPDYGTGDTWGYCPGGCVGADSSCCEDGSCGDAEGDCDTDSDCGDGHVCGADNCNGDTFEATDDCCKSLDSCGRDPARCTITSLGCWNDLNHQTGIPFIGRWQRRDDPKGDCLQYALDNCFDGFAMQDSGTCRTGADILTQYDSLGTSSRCSVSNGLGGPWANNIYKIECDGCMGDDSCCSDGSCGAGQGDCDNDSDCAGSLTCGTDNCSGASFDSSDDCCE